MKILISADIEGVSGVTHPDQIYPEGKFYIETLEKWILEINSIIEGLKSEGINEIIINDSHNHMRNLNNAKIPYASVISGWQKPFSMLCGCDEKIDACLFTGYHSMASSNGVLSHTYRPRIIKKVLLNNKEVGETGLNAALAGSYNIPVIFTSGDNVLCSESKLLFNDNIITVETKKSLSRYSALSYPFEENLQKLKEGAAKAIREKKSWKVLKIESPYSLSVTFAEPNHADAACLIPNTQRISDINVEYNHNDFPTVFKCFLAMGALAASRDDIKT